MRTRTSCERSSTRSSGVIGRRFDGSTIPTSSGKTRRDWGIRCGFDEVRDAWVTWFEAFEQVDFQIEELIEAGDKVVAFIRARGRGRESGLVIDQRLPSVWTVRGGRVVRVRGYREAGDALEAAGLHE
jgi:ketosteroid isomerase-like protein